MQALQFNRTAIQIRRSCQTFIVGKSITLHDARLNLLSVARSLGHTPGRDEYFAHAEHNVTKAQMYELFGGWTQFVTGAGLTPKDERKKKLPSAAEFFAADVQKTLIDYQQLPKVRRIRFPEDFGNTLCIPDTHFPFVSTEVLCAIYEFADRMERTGNPVKRIVQLGDLYDMFSHSRFPRSFNFYTPRAEREAGYAGAAEMWKTLFKICKGAEGHQLLGNHDIRPYLRTLERNPEGEDFFDWNKFYGLFTFPGVALVRDHRQELFLDDIAFIHGHKSGLGEHSQFMLRNTVCGHTHRAGLAFKEYRDRIIFEMNCGLAGDPRAKALGFTPQKITNWTPAFGWIDRDGPRPILC